MGLSLLDDILKTTVLCAAVLFLCTIFYSSSLDAFSMLIGAGWGCANFYLLKQFLVKVLNKDKNGKDITNFIVIAFIKFPFLYGIGYLILKTDFFSVIPIVIGFSLLFVVIFFFGLKLVALNYFMKGNSHGS